MKKVQRYFDSHPRVAFVGGLLALSMGWVGLPGGAQGADQACCEINSNDRTCFDDIFGAGLTCPAGNGLGPGTTCSANCNCTNTCNTCVGKRAGNLSTVEIQLLGSPVFDGTNTTYRYRVCQVSGHDLSHWSLGLSNVCCDRIVSASGGRTTGRCGVDPNTGLFGIKFETDQGVDACVGDCGPAGTTFTVVISGNATSTGCVKAANKANGAENTSTACIVGPNVSCDGQCTTDTQCSDNIPCTIDDCDPGNPNADANGCVHLLDDFACPDPNPCTDGRCVLGVGCQSIPNNNNACGNGQYCDGPETCVSGVCQPGTPPCDDGVPCTANQCDEATDSCSYVPNGAICSDGQYCNGIEICDPVNGCQAGAEVDCTYLDGVCTLGDCDEAANSCVALPVNEGSSCDDGLYCTEPDRCAGGECAGGPRDCSDQIACTNDSCDEDLNQCINFENNGKCDNGLFCDGNEICEPDDPSADLETGCVPGTDPCVGCPCDDVADACVCDCPGNPCPDAPECFHSSCVDGNCVFDPTPGEPCTDDGLSCTADHCDGAGQCVHVPNDSLCAPDQNACTDTICHLLFGCIHVPDDNNGCDDGLFCTLEDRCVDGECLGIPNECDDGVECTDDSCDEAANRCVNMPNDDNCPASTTPCLSYVCHAVSGCVPVFHDGTACDDGLPCTEGDRCQGGQCAGQPIGCDDGLACTADSCDLATGECLHVPQHTLCNDQNLCTDDLCVVGVGCVFTPDDSNVCEDDVFCNGIEFCAKGSCKAGQMPCLDSVGCTVDSCNEAKDVCIHAPDNAICSDGLACTGIEICDRKNGCIPGTPTVCDDGVACTNNECVEPAGTCNFVPKDSNCADGLFCNGDEVCHPTQGCQPGTPPSCQDNSNCSVDSCNEATDTCDHPCPPPGITCIDQTFECDNVGAFEPPIINDNCSVSPIVNCTEETTPGKLPQEYKVTRQCTVTNDCGRSAGCEQVIDIVDTTPPQVTCPPEHLVFECDAEVVPGEPTNISDNCDPDPQVTVEVEIIQGDCTSNVAGISPPPKLTQIVTHTISDGAATNAATGDTTGNVTICEQRIDIIDTHDPIIISCPSNVLGCVGEPLSFTPPTCSDTCGSCEVHCVRSDARPAGDPVTPGLTISCTAIDECTNSSAPCVVPVATDTCDNDIPTVSQWGIVVMTLLLLIGAKLRFAGRRTQQA